MLLRAQLSEDQLRGNISGIDDDMRDGELPHHADGWKRVTLEPAAVLVVLGVAGAALYAAVGEEDPGP